MSQNAEILRMKPRKVASPISGYAFSEADRAKAIARRKELKAKRAEAKETAKLGLEATIAKRLEERADEIVDAMMAAGLDRGEWRALDALIDRHLGKPVQRSEQKSAHLHVVAELRDMSDEDLARALGSDPRPELPPAA
jgi:hypothetical protein